MALLNFKSIKAQITRRVTKRNAFWIVSIIFIFLCWTFWSSLVFWDIVEVVGAMIVAGGVVGEYIHEFKDWPSEPEKRRLFGEWSVIVLILGLGIEALGLGRSMQLSNLEIASLELQAEQIKAQVAWRTLSRPDFEKLVTALSPHPHWGVVIGYVANDPESTAFALQLQMAFWKAGWSPPCHAYQYSGALNWGVFVPDTDGASDAVSAIRRAFASINLPFGTTNPAPPSAWIDTRSNLSLCPDNSALPGCAYLIVGVKQPPFVQGQ